MVDRSISHGGEQPLIPAVGFALDVKRSSVVEKQLLTNTLLDCKEKLNDRYMPSLIVPFDIRKGDELIGVINQFSDTRELIELVYEIFSAAELHYYLGIGVGFLENNETSIHTANGSAVLNALSARDEELKNKGDAGKVWQKIDNEVFFSSKQIPSSALNSLYLTILDKKSQWTKKQQDVISFVERNPDWTFEKIGQELGYKSPKSTVSYLLARSQYLRVKTMENSFDELMVFFETSLKNGGE